MLVTNLYTYSATAPLGEVDCVVHVHTDFFPSLVEACLKVG